MKLKNKLGPSVLGEFSGVVYKHLGRGTQLGFPTANVRLNKKFPHGVYISQTQVGDRWYPSLTFIGIPTTFSDPDERAETYILEGKFDLVGTTIQVKLLVFLRTNKKFSTAAELIQAIQQDESQAKDFFASRQATHLPVNL